MPFDPRELGRIVYQSLSNLRQETGEEATKLREQRNQAYELYTYLSTWGMLRLKAEENALSSQPGKRAVVIAFFECLGDIAGYTDLNSNQGLQRLTNLTIEEYLGLTGLGLQLAQEFSFWATAIYHDIQGVD